LALQLGKQGRFPLWLAIGSMTHGLAIAHQGRADEGIAELMQGLASWERTGAALNQPYQRALLAEACLVAGRKEEGLRTLDASFCRPQEIWWLPEQYRLRAELLLLAPGSEVEAEASLRQALDLARSQESRSLELRAAMSLACLLRKQERAAEGRELLERCYTWFTEGFETPDLQEARALLEEMTPRRHDLRQTTEGICYSGEGRSCDVQTKARFQWLPVGQQCHLHLREGASR
jgi:predicted ATPase